jgi:hypothetical protein
MTLQEWSMEYNVDVQTHPNGGLYVIQDVIQDRISRIELFGLSDYVVHSACGIVLWLWKRPI